MNEELSNNPIVIRAFKLLESTRVLLASVNFTYDLIEKLPDEMNDEVARQADYLYAKLKIDYNEYLKQDMEYNLIRDELNKLFGIEVFKKLPPHNPLDI